jgi:hypothetical protein
LPRDILSRNWTPSSALRAGLYLSALTQRKNSRYSYSRWNHSGIRSWYLNIERLVTAVNYMTRCHVEQAHQYRRAAAGCCHRPTQRFGSPTTPASIGRELCVFNPAAKAPAPKKELAQSPGRVRPGLRAPQVNAGRSGGVPAGQAACLASLARPATIAPNRPADDATGLMQIKVSAVGPGK